MLNFSQFLVILLYIILTPLNLLGSKFSTLKGKVEILDSSGKLKEDSGEVIVFINEVEPGKNWETPKTSPSMASENKSFTPGVLAIIAGTEVSFPNNDRILHNVFSLSKTKTFDLGLYKKDEGKKVLFDKPGYVRVYCNIHEKMVGHILVLANPYFAKAEKDGTFEIKDIPPGKYTVVAWHSSTSSDKQEVIISGAQDVEVNSGDSTLNFRLKAKKKSYKHKNKWGQPYRSKYK